MTRKEAMDIICSENLKGYNWFEERCHKENELVILKREGKWIVYVTDERASKVTGSEREFDNEENAITSFIKRLQALNKILY